MRHPADTFEFKDGAKLRLMNESVLVRMDPEAEETSGGILKPDGAVEHIYMTGTILAFGWVLEKKLEGTSKTKSLEKPYPIPSIEPGLKCCFIRYRRWQDTNKQLRYMFGDDIICLKPEDMIFVFPADEEHELG